MKQLIKLASIMILLPILFIMIASKDISKEPMDIGKRIAQHVVSYNVLSMGNQRIATGFHLQYKGKVYLMTNKHVCDHSTRLNRHKFIQFQDYVGEIIEVDDKHDLCIVTSNRNSGLILSEYAAKPMDELILVGHPRGLAKTIRVGRYMNIEDIYAPWIGRGKYPSIMASIIAYGGNSGSPVCNMDGNVIGVLFAGSPSFHTETLLVPLEYVKKFLEKHIN